MGKLTAPLEILADFIACKDAEIVALRATRWNTQAASVVVGSPRKASGSCAATDEEASSSDESSYEDNAHDNEDLTCAERRITESTPDVWNEQNEAVVEAAFASEIRSTNP